MLGKLLSPSKALAPHCYVRNGFLLSCTTCYPRLILCWQIRDPYLFSFRRLVIILLNGFHVPYLQGLSQHIDTTSTAKPSHERPVLIKRYICSHLGRGIPESTLAKLAKLEASSPPKLNHRRNRTQPNARLKWTEPSLPTSVVQAEP